MAACSDIKEISLQLDKEFNTVLEKNYRIKGNIRENIKEKNLEVLRVLLERTKNEKGCDLNSVLLNVDSNLLNNNDVLLTLERLVDYGIISSKLSAGKRTYKLSTSVICSIKTQNKISSLNASCRDKM